MPYCCWACSNRFDTCPCKSNTLDIQLSIIMSGFYTNISIVKLDPYYTDGIFVIPSSVLVLREISVLSPIAIFSIECSCFSRITRYLRYNFIAKFSDSAPMTVSCALVLYLVPDIAQWALSLNSLTFVFCINKFY